MNIVKRSYVRADPDPCFTLHQDDIKMMSLYDCILYTIEHNFNSLKSYS